MEEEEEDEFDEDELMTPTAQNDAKPTQPIPAKNDPLPKKEEIKVEPVPK